MSLSEEFLGLLADHRPIATVILAHFVVLIHPFEGDLWFLKGWSHAVLGAVKALISEPWAEWIMWPEHCILENDNMLLKERDSS